MPFILLEKIQNLGHLGDVVNVKDGYARNFLIPSGKAQRATKENKAVFEERRKELEAQERKVFEEAQLKSEQMRSPSECRTCETSVSWTETDWQGQKQRRQTVFCNKKISQQAHPQQRQTVCFRKRTQARSHTETTA